MEEQLSSELELDGCAIDPREQGLRKMDEIESPYVELAKTCVDGIDVLKLRSKKTGILVYLAQVNGPSVDGFVCLGKEWNPPLIPALC